MTAKPTNRKDKTVVFLGAGASKADGAPLQGEIFREYFLSEAFQNGHDEMSRELATFFIDIFHIDVDDRNCVSTALFPTFEEVLGILNLSMARREGFRNFDIENRASNSGRIRFMEQHVIFLLAKVLDIKLKNDSEFHKKLIDKLSQEIKDYAFISLNYDILIDNALTSLRESHGISLDYGVEFSNFDNLNDWARPIDGNKVTLLKPHGSLNWLHCPCCNSLEITPKEKGVSTRLIDGFQDSACKKCESVLVPILVPPTYYKDMTKVFLVEIWHKTERLLQEATRIIFCGYSFPDADIHIKYLLKRALVNGSRRRELFVINNHLGKSESLKSDERDRYSRFLGPTVRYTDFSFEEFCNDPRIV